MEIEPPNRDIPARLIDEVRKLMTEGAVALYTGNHARAIEFFSKVYDLLSKAQQEEDRPIHKGASLHNQGLAFFGLGEIDRAIQSILLAYVEDTLNVGYDLEDNADRAPAAHVLRDIFYFNLRIMREIKSIAREIKESAKWNVIRDPMLILEKAAERLRFDINKLTQQCKRELKPPTKVLLGFPQPRERRVFIGTNYDKNPGVIPIIKEAVVRSGYVPVVPFEVGIRLTAIHDESLLLLHTCGYAVIDITAPGGQFMETERAKDSLTTFLAFLYFWLFQTSLKLVWKQFPKSYFFGNTAQHGETEPSELITERFQSQSHILLGFFSFPSSV